MTLAAHTLDKPEHVEDAQIGRFVVQHFNEEAGKWLSINDRVFVRDFMKPGVTTETAVARARTEAERQVSGWSSAFPTNRYRYIPATAH